MSELKEKKTVIGSDVRILSAKEMTLASNLRSMTDSFRYKANRFCQQQCRINSGQEKYRSILKNLREDESIIVTRFDKGKGIVLMNKDDYLLKMYTIINDSTKFKCLPDDPIIKREFSLINLLKRLLKEESITEQFFKIASPKGSNPGRLYGLPKIHKDDTPLRPVLSALKTFNYGLGKALTQMLSDIIDRKNIVRDSFSFIKELQTLPKSFSQYKMVSFDISSLYTNVPLDETISIILKSLYDTTTTTPPKIKRADMKKLLVHATKKSHFLFDGKVYDQIDGVSMGSPLAPLFAEIFLQDFERKHLSSFENIGILYWKRYVDDTFVLIDSTFSTKVICAKLSQYHRSLQFTGVDEDLITNTLSFLDVLVQRQPDVGFDTKIYRKPTFTRLITRWNSFVPKTYKYNAISTLVYRARKICSSYKSLHEEFQFIRELATDNGYPINFVNSIIGRQLNLDYNPPIPLSPSLNTETAVIRVPYFGSTTHIYAKCLTSAVIKHYPLKKIRVVYDVKDRIGSGFTTKDKIPLELKSGVVYEGKCCKCSESYIGKTYRHLKTRIKEHLSEQTKSVPPKHQKTKPNLKRNKYFSQPTTTTSSYMTRSKTGKLPPSIHNLKNNCLKDLFTQIVLVDKKGETTTPKSSIAKHYYSTGHIFTSNDFRILLTEQHKYRLLIKESMLIRKRQPILNGTDRSVPLYVFPDGIEDMKKKKRIRE